MADRNIMDLTKALHVQQQVLKRLYSELDVEREASSTAVSEALSMILRLQGEKASLKMEASQYKRMAEEKMCHAEEALAIFEDLIYQREMEITSLEFQVQAYRYRLLSMGGGCSDRGVYEHKFPDNFLNDKVFPLKDKKSAVERRRSINPLLDYIPKIVEENEVEEVDGLDNRSEIFGDGSIDVYWEQIKKLDKQVKEIAEGKDNAGRKRSALYKVGTWSPSVFSQMSNRKSVDQASGITITTESVHIKHPDLSLERDVVDNSVCSSDALDIKKVTPSTESPKAFEHQKNECRIAEGKGRIVRPDFVSDEDGKLSNSKEKKSIRPSAPTAIGKGNLRAEYQQLVQRIERLEKAKNKENHKISEGEEELNLLKEINEQLRLLQLEMRTWKAKKSFVPDEPSLDPISQAMVYFWF